MVSRSNQQLKKKVIISVEDKLPHTISEDIKDLFEHYDKDKLGHITYTQIKAILHYITGGVLKRSFLENYISESTQKSSNFDIKDVEKLSLKLWEDVGKDQHQKEINHIIKLLQSPASNEDLEQALKLKLSET